MDNHLIKNSRRMEKIIKCKYCGYVWRSRVPNPKSCPRCKQYRQRGYKLGTTNSVKDKIKS